MYTNIAHCSALPTYNYFDKNNYITVVGMLNTKEWPSLHPAVQCRFAAKWTGFKERLHRIVQKTQCLCDLFLETVFYICELDIKISFFWLVNFQYSFWNDTWSQTQTSDDISRRLNGLSKRFNLCCVSCN